MKKRDRKQQIILTVIFCIFCAAILFPFVLVLSVSMSNEADIVNYGYQVIPKRIDFAAYEYIFRQPKSVLDAYKVTIIFSVATMVLSTLLMSMIAYPLSKRGLKGRRGLSFYLYFTMLFGGGMVPTYILFTQYLHLDDTIWVYILPALINPWNVFMMRAFFQGIPEEITESALIDGANEYVIFVKMILPLSKPVLATVALFVFLAKWNDWGTAMIYINKEELISLQYLLQRIMKNIQLIRDTSMTGIDMSLADIPSETVRMAMAVVVAGPALVVFPFFQKYFVKGLTVGAVKG